MKTHQRIRQNAFTLIELLVVITIISIIAAMVLTAGKNASVTKKRTVVEAQRQKIVSMIDEYKATLNYYPPDNGLLATTNAQYYDACASVNPLLYELTGVTNTNGQAMVVFNSSANPGTFISTSTYSSLFNRGGVANGDSEQPHNFYIPPPQPADYAAYPKTGGPGGGNNQLYGLVVPVDVVPNSAAPNFWHYDSSSAQRHNPNSYDLWAEYEIGNKNGALLVLTNGNWH